MKPFILFALLATACAAKNEDCVGVGAPLPPELHVVFSATTTPTFAVDTTDIAGRCAGRDDLGSACSDWIIDVEAFADGQHSLSIPALDLQARTFTIAEGHCGGRYANPDSFTL